MGKFEALEQGGELLQSGPLESEPSYQSLLGQKAWQNLHPAICKRFDTEYKSRAVTYEGMMEDVTLSFMGKLLAYLCRLIGTPLAFHAGRDVPTTVKVYPNKRLGGMTWDRFYRFPDKKVNRVKSTKCIQQKGGLVEVVGCGFGMHLHVTEKDGAICFTSTGFFWRLGTIKVPIANILTPGKTTVVQTALDDKRFRFDLDVVHPYLGRVFRQTGVFVES